MPQRSTVTAISAQQERAGAQDPGDPWRVNLVKVRSGVVAGNTTRNDKIVRTQWWALFMTREQFDACCADDPLRFTDPLLFTQLRTQFDHVFD